MPETSTPAVYTVNEVLLKAKISRTTFYKEVKAGRIRVVKFGRATRVPCSELDRRFSEITSEAA